MRLIPSPVGTFSALPSAKLGEAGTYSFQLQELVVEADFDHTYPCPEDQTPGGREAIWHPRFL